MSKTALLMNLCVLLLCESNSELRMKCSAVLVLTRVCVKTFEGTRTETY